LFADTLCRHLLGSRPNLPLYAEIYDPPGPQTDWHRYNRAPASNIFGLRAMKPPVTHLNRSDLEGAAIITLLMLIFILL